MSIKLLKYRNNQIWLKFFLKIKFMGDRGSRGASDMRQDTMPLWDSSRSRDHPLCWLWSCNMICPWVLPDLQGRSSIPLSDLTPWASRSSSWYSDRIPFSSDIPLLSVELSKLYRPGRDRLLHDREESLWWTVMSIYSISPTPNLSNSLARFNPTCSSTWTFTFPVADQYGHLFQSYL